MIETWPETEELADALAERTSPLPSRSPEIKILFHPPGGVAYLGWTFHVHPAFWSMEICYGDILDVHQWENWNVLIGQARESEIEEFNAWYKVVPLKQSFLPDKNYSESAPIFYLAN